MCRLSELYTLLVQKEVDNAASLVVAGGNDADSFEEKLPTPHMNGVLEHPIGHFIIAHCNTSLYQMDAI